MSWGNFDIPDELKIRKKLEQILNYTIELQKNDDKYGYDISCYRYDTKTNKKCLIGYIELEVSDTWIDVYPDFWKYHSFLARKVFKFDWNKNEFTDELQDNYANTIYLIMNQSMTDMICQSIKNISKLNFRYCNVKDRYYNDCYLRIRKKNKKIICGEDNCSKFIQQFFEEQKILDEFV